MRPARCRTPVYIASLREQKQLGGNASDHVKKELGLDVTGQVAFGFSEDQSAAMAQEERKVMEATWAEAMEMKIQVSERAISGVSELEPLFIAESQRLMTVVDAAITSSPSNDLKEEARRYIRLRDQVEADHEYSKSIVAELKDLEDEDGQTNEDQAKEYHA